MVDDAMYPLCPTVFIGDDITARWAALRPDLFRRATGLPAGLPDKMSTTWLCGSAPKSPLRGQGPPLACRSMNSPTRCSIEAIVNDIAAVLTEARDLYVLAFVGAIPPSRPVGSPVRSILPPR